MVKFYSRTFTKDVLAKTSKENIVENLIKLGYDSDILNECTEKIVRATLKEDMDTVAIDYRKFDNEYAPEIDNQTAYNTVILANNKDGYACRVDDLSQLDLFLDDDGCLVCEVEGRPYQVFGIPDNNTELVVPFVQSMFRDLPFEDDDDAMERFIADGDYADIRYITQYGDWNGLLSTNPNLARICLDTSKLKNYYESLGAADQFILTEAEEAPKEEPAKEPAEEPAEEQGETKQLDKSELHSSLEDIRNEIAQKGEEYFISMPFSEFCNQYPSIGNIAVDYLVNVKGANDDEQSLAPAWERGVNKEDFENIIDGAAGFVSANEQTIDWNLFIKKEPVENTEPTETEEEPEAPAEEQ